MVHQYFTEPASEKDPATSEPWHSPRLLSAAPTLSTLLDYKYKYNDDDDEDDIDDLYQQQSPPPIPLQVLLFQRLEYKYPAPTWGLWGETLH